MKKEELAYRDRLIKGLPVMLLLFAIIMLATGIMGPFYTQSPLLGLLVWGMSWAISFQLSDAYEALKPMNQDHPLWHQNEKLRKVRLCVAVVLYNIALVTEVGRIWGKIPLEFLQSYDSNHGTIWLAGLSYMAYWIGNNLQPSKAEIHMARIEADVQAMRSQTPIPTAPRTENTTDEQAASEQAATEQAATEQTASEQANVESAVADKVSKTLPTFLFITTIAATSAAITAAIIRYNLKKKE